MSGIRLRPWRAGDAAAIIPVLNDPEVLKWSHIAQLGAQRWIAEQRAGRRGPSVAICAPDDDAVLGKVVLRLPGRASAATSCAAIEPSDQPAGELSYWVLPAARGRGIATAAVKQMLEFDQQIYALRSIVLDIEIDNLASIRVAERVGATRREPTRIERDRNGVARTLAVFMVEV